MARKVFISILGVSYYQETNYYFNNENNSVKTRFVQEAALKIIAKEFKQEDIAYIFLTEKAKTQNWESPAQTEHFQVKNKEKETYTGLEETLKNCNFQFQIKSEDIANGDDEKEIWQIFQSVFDVLEKEDEVYFDITHAFRSIPMLVIVLINYAKFLKNISVKSITYGNWEARKNDFSPIIDITSFSTLQDWTSGANEFINFGSAKSISNLATQSKIISVKNFAEKINQFTDNIRTVRGLQIYNGETAKSIIDEIFEIKEENDIPAFSPIFDKISDEVEKFKHLEIENGFIAAKYCLEHNLIQQGITILQETILSYILSKSNLDYLNKDNRNILSACLSIEKISKYRYKNGNDEVQNKQSVELIWSLPLREMFNKTYKKINIDIRNDINHAGLSSNNAPKVFEDILKICIEEAYKIINELNKNNLNNPHADKPLESPLV